MDDQIDNTSERPPRFQDGQDIRDRAFEFACLVVTFCRHLSEGGGVGRLMVPRLLSCSLSFATMLEEARAAESDADFISKCCISLKECRESWTRLRVCKSCQIGPPQEARLLVQESNELIAIVTTIIKNKRKNIAAKHAAEKAKTAATSVIPDRRARSASDKRESTNSKFQIPNS
jgi:four helix bundle protein